LGADRVNISSSHAVELATSVEEPLCTISRNTGAHTRDLLLDTRVMLNTTGDICPGPIILTQGDIISPKITDNIASLSRKRLRAEPGDPRAGL